MRLSTLAAASPAILLTSIVLAAGVAGATPQSEPMRLTGPVSHANLAVYFVHGPSKSGPVPLTLQEALTKGVVRVSETGSVNTLAIENLGEQAVFVQAGDVVKGGRQDRTLTVSLVLPPKSGRIPIASFCVEHGRWSARGAEDAHSFATSAASVPSREMKLAMQAPMPAVAGHRGIDTGLRQQKVWDDVKRAQERLAAATGTDIRSPQSATSLQLALENKKLAEARQAYTAALKAAGAADDDIVGYVFAVNGKLNSAEIYESNGLFRKMWPKLLDASATEAIGHRDDPKGAAPPIAAVTAFLDAPTAAKPVEVPLNFGVRRVTRETDNELVFETASPVGWVHRSYLAK
jgi:ARG and Rhodanese-Phosphatase-superfamily-associated Protein domain